MAGIEESTHSPRVQTWGKKPEAEVLVDASLNTNVRLKPHDRKVTLMAYLALAEKTFADNARAMSENARAAKAGEPAVAKIDMTTIGECWILGRGLAERHKGPRRRWLYGISDDEMLRAMREWVEAFKDVK